MPQGLTADKLGQLQHHLYSADVKALSVEAWTLQALSQQDPAQDQSQTVSHQCQDQQDRRGGTGMQHSCADGRSSPVQPVLSRTDNVSRTCPIQSPASAEACSDAPVLVDDSLTVETPPQNRVPPGAANRRTFSPLSAMCREKRQGSKSAGASSAEHDVSERESECCKGDSDAAKDIEAVLARLPSGACISDDYMRVQQALGKAYSPEPSTLCRPSDCGLISKGYMQVQQALGKSRPPKQQPQQPQASGAAEQLLQQLPHAPKPVGAVRKGPSSLAPSLLDHRNPFAWDPHERMKALHEMEGAEQSSTPKTDAQECELADQQAALQQGSRSCSPMHTPNELLQQESLAGRWSTLSCWDSVSSLEDLLAASAKVQKPCMRAPLKHIPPAKRLHMRKHTDSGRRVSTPLSC